MTEYQGLLPGSSRANTRAVSAPRSARQHGVYIPIVIQQTRQRVPNWLITSSSMPLGRWSMTNQCDVIFSQLPGDNSEYGLRSHRGTEELMGLFNYYN